MRSICLGNKKRISFAVMIAVVLLLNLLAWSSTAFCDWYIRWIFPIWVNTYGRLTGLFPFSVGEWMIVAGVVLVGAALILGGVFAVSALVSACIRRKLPKPFLRLVKGFYGFLAWVVGIVCLIMTLNCTILYHASTFSTVYFGEDSEAYSEEDLFRVYNMVAEECNRLSMLVERDERGRIVYDCNPGEEAKNMMKKLGETYPQLDGWYPDPKPMFFSDFMCQQYMKGYYFPFSMEANINFVMHPLNRPATMCHELAHLRGYIYEDEANFIAYLACIQSEDLYVRYSGYLSVLVYLNNDVVKVWNQNPELYERTAAKIEPCEILPQVWQDKVFVTEEEWDRINGKAIIDTEIVDKAAETFVETNLKLNGVSDGKISYSRVVKLLLQYYCGEGTGLE